MTFGYTMWRTACSCDGNRGLLSHIEVNSRPVAVLGLDLIFQELYAMGQRPETPGLEARLLEMVETTWHDRSPDISDEAFGQALLNSYAAYLRERA